MGYNVWRNIGLPSIVVRLLSMKINTKRPSRYCFYIIQSVIAGLARPMVTTHRIPSKWRRREKGDAIEIQKIDAVE